MPLTFTIPLEGLEPRQKQLAWWAESCVKAASDEFQEMNLDQFCLALVLLFKHDMEDVITACVGKTDELRQ